MKRFLSIVAVLMVVTGVIVVGRATGGAGGQAVVPDSSAEPIAASPIASPVALGSGWYKIPYFPDPQPHCSADLLASVCCLNAYLPVSQVDDACQLSSAQVVRVIRDPLGVSSCCNCSHDFCVQITSSTPVVQSLPHGACTLIVLECYNSCNDCMGDL
jgi:hypothetical protein